MPDKPTGADWDAMKDAIREQDAQTRANQAAKRRRS